MDKKRSHESDGSDFEEEEEEQVAMIHPKLAKTQSRMQVKDKTSKSPGWINRQRTLIFCSRGVSYRVRHLMTDLRALMPHSKKDVKLDRKDKIGEVIPEICEMRNCNNCIYLEMRKKQDSYMWISKMPHGPSAKFLIQNLHTMDELKLTGNFLKGSRPLLNFDPAFDSTPHYKLLKELFFQVFGTPNKHPKSKPFFDHVMSFYILDNRIWVRVFQISWKESAKASGKDTIDHETVLTEAGPRFVLNPIRIFEGTFGGPTLYENPHYVSPNEFRSNLRKEASTRYKDKQAAKERHSEHTAAIDVPTDEVEEVFYDANKDN